MFMCKSDFDKMETFISYLTFFKLLLSLCLKTSFYSRLTLIIQGFFKFMLKIL